MAPRAQEPARPPPLPARRYPLGNAEFKVGYDVLNASDDYLAFDREAELFDLRPEHVVADMGCGTGNAAASPLRRRGHKTRPVCVCLRLSTSSPPPRRHERKPQRLP